MRPCIIRIRRSKPGWYVRDVIATGLARDTTVGPAAMTVEDEWH